MQIILLLFMELFIADAGSGPYSSYQIIVKINGIKTDKGIVFINIYSSPEGFPANRLKSYRTICVKPQNLTAEAAFTIAEGTYAIAVMHDENGNGKMDKNFLGIPKEGYCVSNNAVGFMAAPSFNDAKFELNHDAVLTLKMIN